MARFPKTEAGIQTLGHQLAIGLQGNPVLYPAPPVLPTALQALVGAYQDARDAATAAQAAAEQATTAKRTALRALTTAVRKDLRYAESVAGGDDALLTALGWGARAQPTPLTPPGQVRSLSAPRQDGDSLFLDWKAPAEGGMVAAYRIERRLCPSGAWGTVAVAVECGATLAEQERGREWEYRVAAVNRAGAGAPSNTVAVVL